MAIWVQGPSDAGRAAMPGSLLLQSMDHLPDDVSHRRAQLLTASTGGRVHASRSAESAPRLTMSPAAQARDEEFAGVWQRDWAL
jgi:hypothetical protein